MNKLFLFAIAAAAFAACSSEELASPEAQQANGSAVPVNFDVYAQRTVTRSGLPGNNGTDYGITTASLQTGFHKDAGFGVFGYYTSNSLYDTNNSTPNFMYNQQVTYSSSNTSWTYEPVKYWPNEYGDAAASDDLDKVSFFAYAPWVNVTVNTGVPTVNPTSATAPTAPEATTQMKYTDSPYSTWTATDWSNVSVTVSNPASPTPTEAAAMQAYLDENVKSNTAQDWTWNQYLTKYSEYLTAKLAYDLASPEQDQKLNITQVTKNTESGDPVVKYVVDTKPATSVDLLWGVAAADVAYTGMDAGTTVKPGNCFVDLTKQNSVAGKLKWNFKHALARLNVQICTVVDKATPGEGTTAIGTEGDGTTVDNKTKVWLRSVTFDGFATKGALNLHSEEVASSVTDYADRVKAAVPKWLDYDGSRELTYGTVTFYDGLKDGKEGTSNNIQKNETPQGLNPALIQLPTSTGVPITLTNLFYGSANINDPIYIIPSDEEMNITVVYDVETEDAKLAGVLADNKTHGSAIENCITKTNVFSGTKIEAGKTYVVKIYLGIESVKFDVEVTDWATGGSTDVELPKNL